MRRTSLVVVILSCAGLFSFFAFFAFGQTDSLQAASPQSASSQTARQALLEMFFGEKPNHLEKHLPDVTRRSLSKLSSPDAPNVLAEFSMISSQIRSEGTALQMFDTGPTLLTAEEPRGGGNGIDKIELTVERDDLIGDEDQIELALHTYKNGKEESLPVIPRFTFSMQSDADVWRLNEISVTVRVPLSDPTFLKTIENQQRSRNEQMVIFALQQVNTAEKGYSAAQGHFACSLAALGMHKGESPAYLWDAQLAGGKKNGYVFVISSCDPSHYKVVAEPAIDDSGQRAFCSDEGGSIRAAADGKATTCLSSGEVVQEAMGDRATGVAVLTPNPPAGATPQAGTATQKPTTGGVGGSTPGPVGDPPRRVRISQGVTQNLLITKVQPIYPEEAKAARAQGSVVLGVVIGKDGTIQSFKVNSSPSTLLNEAAIDAVKQWKYKPFLLNGTPAEVETTIVVNFALTNK